MFRGSRVSEQSPEASPIPFSPAPHIRDSPARAQQRLLGPMDVLQISPLPPAFWPALLKETADSSWAHEGLKPIDWAMKAPGENHLLIKDRDKDHSQGCGILVVDPETSLRLSSCRMYEAETEGLPGWANVKQLLLGRTGEQQRILG